MNPILALLTRRSGGQQQLQQQQQNAKTGSSSKSKLLSKSMSVVDHLGQNPQQLLEKESPDNGGFCCDPVGGSSNHKSKRVESLERNCEQHQQQLCQQQQQQHQKKRSASESNLLNPSVVAPADVNTAGSNSCEKTIETEEGYYRSFDDHIDDIDDLGVLANSNSLEAAVVLRTQPEAFAIGDTRCSFNSSDSGRMSDTYAETSNSSVTSSSNGSSGHSNRLYSNTSNCSGDSGTQLSVNSEYSTVGKEKGALLAVLKEQDSPSYPPFDNEIYGTSIAVKAPSQTSQNLEDTTYSRIEDHTGEDLADEGSPPPPPPPPLPPRFATVRKSFTLPHNMSMASAEVNAKRKDLSNYFGLQDQGPGTPSREVAQMVALQNLPPTSPDFPPPPAPSELISPSKKNLGKFFGIQQQQQQQQHPQPQPPSSFHSLPKPNQNGDNTKRTRPKSLGFNIIQMERSASIQHQEEVYANPTTRSKLSNIRALNKTLSRLATLQLTDGSNHLYAQSAPTTPEYPQQLQAVDSETSPRRKNLSKFLGLPMPAETPDPNYTLTQQVGTTPLPPPPLSGILKKTGLSNSTPLDLDQAESEANCVAGQNPSSNQGTHSNNGTLNHPNSVRWQSNDGLATPGSLQGGVTPTFLTPSGSPRVQFPRGTGAQKPDQLPEEIYSSGSNYSVGPKHSTSMFSLASSSPFHHNITANNSSNNNCSHNYTTGSLRINHHHSNNQQHLAGSRLGGRSLQRGVTLQATQPPKVVQRRHKPLPPVRSVTLDDMQPPKSRDPAAAAANPSSGVVWVPRRGESLQIRRHSLHHQFGIASLGGKRRSQSSVATFSSDGRARPSLNAGPTSQQQHRVHFAPKFLSHSNNASLENLVASRPSTREPIYVTMGGSQEQQQQHAHHHKTTIFINPSSSSSGGAKQTAEPEYLDMSRIRALKQQQRLRTSFSTDSVVDYAQIECCSGQSPQLVQTEAQIHNVEDPLQSGDSRQQQQPLPLRSVSVESHYNEVLDRINIAGNNGSIAANVGGGTIMSQSMPPQSQ